MLTVNSGRKFSAHKSITNLSLLPTEMIPGYVFPGQVIIEHTDPEFDKYLVGYGTEKTDAGIIANLLGKVEYTETDDHKFKLNIINKLKNPYAQIPEEVESQSNEETIQQRTGNSRTSIAQLPQVGDVVYARVQRITPQQVNLDIIALENKGNVVADNAVGISASSVGCVHPAVGVNENVNESGKGYGAAIRIQDIRSTERDKIKIVEQFSPGDLVRAVVLSLGDGNRYYLSTVRNDLGVIFARDPITQQQLVPLDWQTMADPTNGLTYPRKCANPFV